jgi:hypothetical protein
MTPPKTPQPGPCQHGLPTIILGDCCLSIDEAWRLAIDIIGLIRLAESGAAEAILADCIERGMPVGVRVRVRDDETMTLVEANDAAIEAMEAGQDD